MSGFEKMFASKKSRFGSFYSVKTTYFAFLVLFLKSIFLNWKFQYASDFDLRGLQRVRFEIAKNTFSKSYWTRHFFILRKHNTSDFHLKVLQPLRDELTSGSFQLYIWRLKLQQTLSFNFPPQNKLLLTLKEKIFDQSELQKHDKTQISEIRTLKLTDFEFIFSNASELEIKCSKRVIFWFKSFTTRQIWDWKKNIFKVVLNASCFH